MTGKCVKCGKGVKFGTDGSCKCCHKEICWECWVAAGHECPNCGDFDGKRDNAAPHTGAVAPSVQALVGNSVSGEQRKEQ